MLKSKVPDIYLAKISLRILNFNFTLIMKFNLENRIFYLCPNVAGFLKNVFKRQIRAHFKKKI